jgi:phospholipase A-2-activating protein
VADESAAIGRHNRNILISLTSTAFNYACLAYAEHKKSTRTQAVGGDVLTLLANVLGKVICDQNDSEVLYRALMALGMLVLIGGDLKDMAKALGAEDWAKTAVERASEDRVRNLGNECLALLR